MTGASRQVRASPAQELRWRGSSFELVNRIYRLRGRLDPEALETAVATVMARHESLRCSLLDDGELIMRIHPRVPTPLQRLTAEGDTAAERERWLAAFVAAEINRPLDRGTAPLLRTSLVRLDETEHAFVVVIDHIIADGSSLDVFARELGDAYRAALGEEIAVRADVGQYPDWVAQERATLTEELLAEYADFWRSLFPGGPKDMAVWLSGYCELDKASPDGSGIIETRLDEDVVASLRAAAQRINVTLFVLTATVLVRLLQRDTGQRRITLSTSSISRFDPQTTSMIGYLGTSVWVPTTLGEATDLPAAAHAFRRDLYEVVAYTDVPPRLMFERLWGSEARARMDGFPQVGFLCAPFWGGSLTLPDIDVTATEHDDGDADLAMSLYLTDRGSQVDVQARYLSGVVTDRYAQDLLADYVSDLVAVAADFG